MSSEVEVSPDRILFDFFKLTGRYDMIKAGTSRFQPGYESKPFYKTNLEALKERLTNGWTAEMIRARFKSAKLEGVKVDFLNELIPIAPPIGTKEDVNLLVDGVSYKHPELREVKKALYTEDGVCVSSSEVTRRKSYTLGDMITYFNKTLRVRPPHPREDVSRTLRTTLNKGYTIDQVLRAIDMWSRSDDENPGSRLQDLIWIWVRKA